MAGSLTTLSIPHTDEAVAALRLPAQSGTMAVFRTPVQRSARSARAKGSSAVPQARRGRTATLTPPVPESAMSENDDRLLSGGNQPEDDGDLSLRPKRLAEYIGQTKV